MHTSVLFPLPPQTTSGLGTHSGGRTGTELVYLPLNVLLMDEFPSQRKDQVHTYGCVPTASSLSLPGGAMFKQHAAAALNPVGISKAVSTVCVSPQPRCTFAILNLQPKSSSVQEEEMLPAEAAILSTSFLTQSSFAT